MALWSVAFLGPGPVASLLDGALVAVAALGPRGATLVKALPVLVAAAALWLRRRRARPRPGAEAHIDDAHARGSDRRQAAGRPRHDVLRAVGKC